MEKHAAHLAEIAADPVRSSVSHSEMLRDVLDREHRPYWLQRMLWVSGISDWVDSSLCYMLNWACPEPPAFYESDFGRTYFWALASTDVFVATLMISVLGGLLSRLCDLRIHLRD